MARKYHDKEWLRNQYVNQDKTSYDIAAEVGVSKSTILKWLHKFDIETRPSHARPGVSQDTVEELHDKERMEREYLENGLSMNKIAQKYGVSDEAVRYWMKKHGIELRDKHEAQRGMNRASKVDARLDDAEWLHEEYIEKEKSQMEIAKEIGITQPTVKYYLDKYGIPRRTENMHNLPDTVFQSDPEWQERRKARLEMDDYTCQDCGVSQDEFDRSLDVHHTVPKQEFIENGEVNWGKANDPEVLITLCRSCHAKRHRNTAEQ